MHKRVTFHVIPATEGWAIKKNGKIQLEYTYGADPRRSKG